MVDDRLRLYWDSFKNIRIPIPSEAEQYEIVTVINGHKKKIAALSAALTDSITLLKERRSALITAAVTDQIPLEEMGADYEESLTESF